MWEKLFFFGDDEIVALVDESCSAFGVDVEIRLLLEALPQHALAERLTTLAGAWSLIAGRWTVSFILRRVLYYWRDLKGSGEEVYSHLLAIWLSKISLVAGFVNSVDASTPLAWVDSSLVRIKGNRSNWCFWKQSVVPGRVCHYASPMRYLEAVCQSALVSCSHRLLIGIGWNPYLTTSLLSLSLVLWA